MECNRHPTQIYAMLGAASIFHLGVVQASEYFIPTCRDFVLEFHTLIAAAALLIAGFRADSALLVAGIRTEQVIAWLVFASGIIQV